MTVVDTTVIGDLWFNGEALRDSAKRLLKIDPEWICMELVRYELGNVARNHVAFGGMEEGAAQLGMEGAFETLAEFVEGANWLEVLHIAMADELSYYDASHVWLARSRGLKLRTRDKGILRKCPDVAVAMPEL